MSTDDDGGRRAREDRIARSYTDFLGSPGGGCCTAALILIGIGSLVWGLFF